MRTIPGGIRGNTLAQQIRAALMEQILSGELSPGTRLKDGDVAAQFGTSNTPVREALRELAKDGLVEIQPYRGCLVRRMDLDELAEIFDVRVALEAFVVRLAAHNLTATQLGGLESLVEQYEAAVASDDRDRADQVADSFHHLLAEATGNHTLACLLRHFSNRIQLARRMYLRQRRAPPHLSCRPILEALQAGDTERAAALMADHIICAKQELIEGLQGQVDIGMP